MKWSRMTAAVALALAALPAVKAFCADSGGYRGPERNGIYPETGLMKRWPEGGPKLLWKYDQLGDGWGSANVTGGAVYVAGGAPGSVFAFTLDGKLKWKTQYGPEFTSRFNGPRATPSVSDGLVFISSGKKDERSVYCLDAATGELKWHVDARKEYGGDPQGWGYNESPLVVDNLVVLTLRSKNDVTPPIVALDKRTGKLAWKADVGVGDLSAGDNSLILIEHRGRRMIFDHLWRAFVALEVSTGKLIWKQGIKNGSIITPVHKDGYVLCGNGVNYGTFMMARLADDGKGLTKLWEQPGNAISQGVILGDKAFLLGSVEKAVEEKTVRGGKEQTRTVNRKVLCLMCLDRDTGKLLKAEPIHKEGSICAADGMVYLLEGGEGAWQKGEPARTRISLIKPTDEGFEVVSSFHPVMGTKEAWTNPAIAEGRLFVRHGNLLAVYDIKARPEASAKMAP